MRFKIIHVYFVDANTRAEAVETFISAKKEGKEDRFFQSEVIKIAEDQETGWVNAIKKQFGGK